MLHGDLTLASSRGATFSWLEGNRSLRGSLEEVNIEEPHMKSTNILQFSLAIAATLTVATVIANRAMSIQPAPAGSSTSVNGPGNPKPVDAPVRESVDPAFVQLLADANAGKIEAQMGVATAYSKGTLVKRDPREAVRWWTRAAEQNEVDAMFLLGMATEGLSGLTPNGAEAIKWYGKGAAKGHIHSMNRLATIHLEGKLTEKSVERAVEYSKQAAALGDPGAMTVVAIARWEGEGVPRDRDEARRLYRKAAEIGWGPACQNLGLICLQEDALPFDARIWFEKGVAGGHLECAYNLAKMLEEGVGGSKDPARAAQLYAAAARGGHGKAMNNYACMLAEGVVIQRDLVEACKWCLVADQLGVQSARPNLRLYSSHLNEAGRAASVSRAEIFLQEMRKR